MQNEQKMKEPLLVHLPLTALSVKKAKVRLGEGFVASMWGWKRGKQSVKVCKMNCIFVYELFEY